MQNNCIMSVCCYRHDLDKEKKKKEEVFILLVFFICQEAKERLRQPAQRSQRSYEKCLSSSCQAPIGL